MRWEKISSAASEVGALKSSLMIVTSTAGTCNPHGAGWYSGLSTVIVSNELEISVGYLFCKHPSGRYAGKGTRHLFPDRSLVAAVNGHDFWYHYD
jgi:hypothetical protein